MIQPFLKDVKQIRILVGIDVDHLIFEAAKKGLEKTAYSYLSKKY